MVISHDSRVGMEQNGKTIVYDLKNIDKGEIVGSNKWNNDFLINSGTTKVTGGSVANKFILTGSSFFGSITVRHNSSNIFDFSEIKDDILEVNITHIQPHEEPRFINETVLEVKVNNHSLVSDVVNSTFLNNQYYYTGRQNKVDKFSCVGGNYIVDSRGGYDVHERDIIRDCTRAVIWPNTDIMGSGEDNSIFYVRKNAKYGSKSVIGIHGTGNVVFLDFNLLNCSFFYLSDNNTLVIMDRGTQYTVDVKNYINRVNNYSPNFVLIDKNGSNIVPRIEKQSSIISSFELFTEYSLDNLNATESYYKSIINSADISYMVFGTVRDKNDDKKTAVFASSGNDIIELNEGVIFAKGNNGSDIYVLGSNVEPKNITISNFSNDDKLDLLVMPKVPEELSVRGCDLYLDYSGTRIQIENYLQSDSNRHFIIMNDNRETFIPNVQETSCVFLGNVQLLPFFYANPTQNAFSLSKDFKYDEMVIASSHIQDIERYKDRNDLLLISKMLVNESEVSFTIRIEEFYANQNKWSNVKCFIWNDNRFFPYFGLSQSIDEVRSYVDKLREYCEKTVKEYRINFINSTNIKHNQNVEEDDESIGVIILEGATPDQIMVSSNNKDLVLRDKKSNHNVTVENWDNSKSYRISRLEFGLDLETIKIRRLDRFDLSNLERIQNLISKASENYQEKDKYNYDMEGDFKCLVSINAFTNGNQTYECLGFSSLQDQINFVEDFCSKERVEEFKNKIPSSFRILSLLLNKFSRDLYLNAYDQSKVDQCNRLIIASEPKVLKLLTEIATKEGRVGRIKYFVNIIANEGSAFKNVINAQNSYGETLLHLAVIKCLMGYTRENFSVVKLLLEGGSDAKAKSMDGKTPIHSAITLMNTVYILNDKALDINLIKLLVSKDITVVDSQDSNGNTPIHLVIYYDRIDLVKCLIKEGASSEILNFARKTPLDLAKEKESRKLVNYLEEARNSSMQLRDAVIKSDLNLIQSLFRSKSEYISIKARDIRGQTLLHLAVDKGNIPIMHELIHLIFSTEWDGINAKDNDGRTPLHVAVAGGKSNVIEYLVGGGSDTQVKDNNGRTPLHVAAANGRLWAVRYFIGVGIDIQVEDNDGNRPLEVANERNGLEVIKVFVRKYLMENKLDSVERFLKKTAEPVEIEDKEEWKANWKLLHYFTYNGKVGILRDLFGLVLKKSGGIDIRESQYGYTPLHCAVYYNRTEMVRFLIEGNASINIKDNVGKTPLHVASVVGNLDIVKYLVGKEIGIFTKDKEDKTPLDIARDKGYSNIVEYLEKKLKEEREKPAQRKRRHHRGDHNRHHGHLSRRPLSIDQPQMATSSGAKPSSWINSCISWAKSLAASTFSIIPGLPAQYNIVDKNVKSDNNNIPQSISSVGWNNFLHNENITFASCVADALDDTPSRRYKNLISKGVEVIPSRGVVVEFALRKFDSFVEGKIRNLGSKEQARIRVELKDAYPEITVSLERGVEFSGNVGLDNVLEECKKCFCINVLPKDKVSTCLSEIGVTKLGGNLNR